MLTNTNTILIINIVISCAHQQKTPSSSSPSSTNPHHHLSWSRRCTPLFWKLNQCSVLSKPKSYRNLLGMPTSTPLSKSYCDHHHRCWELCWSLFFNRVVPEVQTHFGPSDLPQHYIAKPNGFEKKCASQRVQNLNFTWRLEHKFVLFCAVCNSTLLYPVSVIWVVRQMTISEKSK